MKKFWITLLSVLMLVTCVAFAASCKKDKDGDVLANYVLTEDGTLVNDDFVLPLTVGDKEVTWESDNAAIAVEKRTEDYLAKVTLGDEAKTVKLTVKCGDKSKEFEVTVGAFDVYYFSKNYTFKQENATVYSTFDLDTSVTLNGKTASISWSVKEDYAEYIKISEDGTKCYVFESVKEPEVRISATFTYNEQTTKVPYRMTVSVKRDHLEEINSYYYNMGSTMDVSGYVVAFGEAWTEKYGNVSFYMVDEDLCTGYYIYHIKTTEAEAALLTEGVHVTVSNIKSTTYNGLVESTQNQGTLVIDKDKDGNVVKISDEDKAKLVYALDNDLLAGAPAAIYQTGRMVSLDKWTVTSKPESAPASGATATLFTLKKGDVEVTVAVSKYLVGVYDTTNAEDTVYKPLKDLYTSVNVGDVISVKGILSKYKDNYQILPLKADDVVVGGEATTVPEACTNVKAAIAAVNEAIKDNTSLTADKSFNLPTTSDGGVAIKYELLHTSTAVTLDGGAVTVTVGAEDKASIKVTYTVKNGETLVYETCTFFTINSKAPVALSDADKAKAELDKVEATLTVSKSGETVLAASTTDGIKLEWAVKEGTTLPSGVTLDKGTLNVTAADTTVTLTVTATCGTETKSKDVTVTIKVDAASANTAEIALTVESLGLASQSYADGSKTVSGVDFSWTELGNYGDGLQMRSKNGKTSSLWNTVALGKIKSVVLVWQNTKQNYHNENALKVEFANNAEFTGAQEKFVTFTADTAEVKPEGEYTFVRITHNITYANYVASITIGYEGSASSGGNESGNTLSALTVIAGDLSSATFSADAPTSWDEKGVIKFYTSSTEDKKWELDTGSSKPVKDAEGNDIGSSNGRVKPNGKYQYITVDLTSYSGSYKIALSFQPAGSSARTIKFAEIDGSGNVVGDAIYSHTNDGDSNPIYKTCDISGGKIYKIYFETNGFNFYGINIVPVA